VDEYCGRFWWNACKNDTLIFLQNSKQWKGYSFKLILETNYNRFITHFETTFSVDGTKDLTIVVNGKRYRIAK
jgi:maltose phosphorylase